MSSTLNEADKAIARVLQVRQLNRSVEQLLGLVTGIVADEHLHDLEIRLLSTWLSDNKEVTRIWPGSAIAAAVQTVLADGVITEDERAYLLTTLRQLATTDFAATGSASPEVVALPLDEECEIFVRDAVLCLTGEFLHGTRSACEKIAIKAGSICASGVSKKVHFVVIGTNVSPHWLHTSYGTKIQAAMKLKDAGHPIRIISERRWISIMSSVIAQAQ